MHLKINKNKVLNWLEEVKDPEIPVLSLIDLGVIREVKVDKTHGVKVKMTPTFTGCPAMDYMKKEVEGVLEKKGVEEYEVKISFESRWNSNMISEKGRRALKKFGLAPPPQHNQLFDLDILENIECPYCGSENTEMRTPFGPTLCRSMHYCHACKQAFEQFKPL